MHGALIAITTYNSKNAAHYPIAAVMHQYIQAVESCGGLPLLAPCTLSAASRESLLARADGILFTGGGDIATARYHGEDDAHVHLVDELRDEMELPLAERVVAAKKPFLAICRGLQVINVALGGTLYAHIPAQKPGAIKHDYDSGTERELLAHGVRVEGHTRLGEIVGGGEKMVNSLHHQGVKELAAGLKATAWAEDELVEAFELPDHPFGLAVQWHPEWLMGYPQGKELFRAFIQAAGGGAK